MREGDLLSPLYGLFSNLPIYRCSEKSESDVPLNSMYTCTRVGFEYYNPSPSIISRFLSENFNERGLRSLHLQHAAVKDLNKIYGTR